MPKKGKTMWRCRECGVPRLVGFNIKWSNNGTVVGSALENFKVVILHQGFIENLLGSIESTIGISIEHLAFEAQRNAARDAIGGIVDTIPGARFATRFNFVRRLTPKFFHRISAFSGMAKTKTTEYVPGKHGEATIKNPFNIDLMAAIVVGAFEALEVIAYKATWEEESKDNYIVRTQATSEKPGVSERLSLGFEKEHILPGNLQLDRCPRCKVPRAIGSSLKWIEDEGRIVDTRTGARVIFLDAYMLSTVVRELAAELGDEIYGLVVEAQRDWTVDNVGELGLSPGDEPLSEYELAAAYQDYLKMFPLYGYGNPITFEASEGSVRLTVENPYEPSILAGTFQGLYEALEKRKNEVSWERPRKSAVSFTVEPVE